VNLPSRRTALLAAALAATAAAVALALARPRPAGESGVAALAAWAVRARPDGGPGALSPDALARAARRRAVADDLVAGRTTLARAAAEFRALGEASPAYWGLLRLQYPGASDEECVCRNVLAGAEAALLGQPPARRREVMGRLEAELRRHLAGAGVAPAPAPAPAAPAGRPVRAGRWHGQPTARPASE
jgi:hypothetical protein